MLKVSAFYLEKQKSFIPKKYDLSHRQAKRVPTEFQLRFWLSLGELEISRNMYQLLGKLQISKINR